jgi:GT2 family glycosyltransferase
MNALHLFVSIVVYELDKPILGQCLRSLESSIARSVQANSLSEWSLTIVDNGKNGESLDNFKSENIRIVKNQHNVGYGAAHNQVIVGSTSEFHLILNPDVTIGIDYVSQTIEYLIGNSDVVLAGPRGVTADGEDAYLCKRFPSVLVLFVRGLRNRLAYSFFRQKLARYEYHDLPDSEPSEVELLSGCCMFARTQALQDVGGFDEHFFLYFEDFDLSLRMRKLGRVVFLPTASIIHFGGNSALKGLHHIKLFAQSAFRFFQKHRWKII